MFDNKLREPHFQQLFRHTADSLGVAVPSVAMSGFFAQSFLERENYRDLVQDCLNTMDVMGAKVAFLPLGGSGRDWVQAGPAHDELVRRLHDVGEMARLSGKTIAIRTALLAHANLLLLKEVKSEGIKIYYNLQDIVDQKVDPCKDLKQLGAVNIAQIHASLTDSVTLDKDPRIDLHKVKKVLDKMKWSGWLVVERSRNAADVKNVRGNYGTNVAYLKEIFQGNK
jgi:sugar phosphate isomerase/epimerase